MVMDPFFHGDISNIDCQTQKSKKAKIHLDRSLPLQYPVWSTMNPAQMSIKSSHLQALQNVKINWFPYFPLGQISFWKMVSWIAVTR